MAFLGAPYNKKTFETYGILAREVRPFTISDNSMIFCKFLGTGLLKFGERYGTRHFLQMAETKEIVSIYGSYELDDQLKRTPLGAQIAIARLGRITYEKTGKSSDNYIVRIQNIITAPRQEEITK